MRFRDALKYALKYHALAWLPTLLGLGIALAGLWLGVGRGITGLTTLPTQSPTQLLASLNLPLAVGGLVAGFFVRRVGRTTLLLRTHGQAVQALEATGPDAASESEGSAGAFGSDAASGTVEDGDPLGGEAAAGDAANAEWDAEGAGTYGDDTTGNYDAATSGDSTGAYGTDGAAGYGDDLATDGESGPGGDEYDDLGFQRGE